MAESRQLMPQQLFNFCYNLYHDPVYRFLCFPPDKVADEGAPTEEQFLQAWHSLSAPNEKMSGMQQALARVISTVRTLKPVEQNVLLLRHGGDLPYRQIAEQVDRSTEACQVIHYRALSHFCSRLGSGDSAHV